MTSNPPAQPRPPPIPFNAQSLIRQRSLPSVPTRTTSYNPNTTVDPSVASDNDQRPLKRRKLEVHAASPLPVNGRLSNEESQTTEQKNARYIAASWSATRSDHAVRKSGSVIGAKHLPSLPVPPWGNEVPVDPPMIKVRTSCRTRADISVPNTPDTLRCSSDCPILEPKKPADYFPWTGKHPEDVINETNVKQGYYDRAPQPPERELNTAKAPLYNAFKHRSGMGSLSALFSLLIEQKSKHSALGSGSTFRPPPRVTLTETKRKSWIADLADSTVPLRRLSRTIPQGVRGQALLEQCLVHNVPLNRAIWFVKCVGANEIRTLKRKGVNPSITAGAEYKWSRDWTANVEQFLETAIIQPVSEKWQRNLRYSFELCARLFQENLLNRDVFLDWIVKSFATCKLEQLGTWLLLIQQHRLDLVKFRKRARQLAQALVFRFQELDSLKSLEVGLRDRLSHIIHGLASFRPGCFVMPDQWTKLQDTLRSCFNLQNSDDRQTFEHIASRNESLLEGRTDEVRNGSEKHILETLDEASVPLDVSQLSQNLLNQCSDFNTLGQTCLRWATTSFRGGRSRIYLVARLLRRWQKIGHDIDNMLLTFFTTERKVTTICVNSYRHLLAELSRARNFSNSRFLQWISIGVSHSRSDSMDSSIMPMKMYDCAGLLNDLYLNEAEDHVKTLKNHLLKRTGQHSSQNSSKAAILKAEIQSVLESDSQSAQPTTHHLDMRVVQLFDWETRFELTKWLRTEALLLAELAAVEIIGKPPLPGSRLFTLNQFLIIRDAVEAAEDISTLADILHILAKTKQETILAALVDTIHCNALALSAIGALEPLQQLYGQAYLALRSTRPSILLFTTALLDLCYHYPCQLTPFRALQNEFVRGDRGRALAACSPFSDGVAESLQQAGVTFLDDFEAILQAESNMNEQTMISLFTVLIGRIMKSGNDAEGHSTFILCQLLARLRLFRLSQADLLIKKWVGRLFSVVWSRTHQGIVLELLYTRCISIEVLLALSDQAPPASQCKNSIRELIRSAMLPHSSQGQNQQQYYVLKVGASHLIVDNPVRAFDILSTECAMQDIPVEEVAQILYMILSDSKKLSTVPPAARKTIPEIIDRLTGTNEAKSQNMAERTINEIDLISLPFCQYRLSMMNSDNTSLLDETEVERLSLTTFGRLKLTLGDEPLQAGIMQAILSVLPHEVQSRVRRMTERQFFDALPKFFQSKAVTQPVIFTAEERKRSQEAVDRLIALGPVTQGTSSGNSMAVLIEKLTMIAKLLGGKMEVTAANPAYTTTAPSPISPAPQNISFTPQWEGRYRESILGMLDYLEMLIKFASIKIGSFDIQPTLDSNAVPAKQTQNEQIKMIALLASIATQPAISQVLQSTTMEEAQQMKVRECMAFALDMAATIADDLSEESRVLCTRILKDRLRDARIQWLIGSMNSCTSMQKLDGQRLVMMHEGKGSVVEFVPKQWEMLESGGGKEGDTCLGLGLFGAKKV